MAFLISYDEVRTAWKLSSTVLADADIRTERHAAQAKLIIWVGQAYYDESAAEISAAREGLAEGENLLDDGALSIQASALWQAELKLALAELAPNLNVIYSGPGLQRSVVTERGQTNSLTPAEVKGMQENLRREAAAAAQDYLQAGYPGATISRARDEAGERIGED